MNLFVYALSDPVDSGDPFGLIKWKGEVYSAALVSGMGGGVFWFDLKSECINGRYAYIRVKASGFGAGFGAKLTGGGAGVSFDDGASDIYPEGFSGQFRMMGANAGIGLVGGWSWYQLGSNFSDIGPEPSPGIGFDFSIVALKGSSKVVGVEWKSCGCE